MTRPRSRGRLRPAWFALAGAMLVPFGLAPATAAPLASRPHVATTYCVDHGPGCTTLKAALKHAHDGDTIKIAPGTYRGGVLVNDDVTIVGAGAGRTTIKGGGPVITLGRPLAKHQPSLVLRDLTVTGGLTRALPKAYGSDFRHAIAVGGGILANYGKNNTPSGALTLIDAVVRGNRVSPTSSVLFSPEDGGDCPEPGCEFAAAYGGGIETDGPVRLVRSTVSGNLAGSAATDDDTASDATGAGIDLGTNGTLTMIDSTVSGNRAAAQAPNGRFVEGAGIWAAGPSLVLKHSSVTDNRGVLTTAFSDEVETVALGGGIRAGFATHVRGVDARISKNRITVLNTEGTSTGWSGGFQVNGTVDLTDSTINSNQVRTGSIDNAFPAYADGGGGEINGDEGDDSSLTNTTVRGNTLSASSASDDVTLGGAGLFNAPFDPGSVALTRSHVEKNTLSASAPAGTINAYGAGVWNIGGLVLDRSSVSDNTTSLGGNAGAALGGGVFNGAYAPFPDLPITPMLTATDSEITGNTLGFSAAMSGSGSGVYTETLPTLTDTTVSGNFPEPQCQGCTADRRVSPRRYHGPHGAWARHAEHRVPPALRWLR